MYLDVFWHKHLRHHNFKEEEMNNKQEDYFFEGSEIDIGHCRTVCLTLGPYRNLTTLTAAVLFLHPNCQVLNHAGDRIFDNSEVNFLSGYTRDKFNNFISYAAKISSGGKRGDYGGSITYSHAFDSTRPISNIVNNPGQNLLKEKIDCLYWKESLRTSNFIKDNNINLEFIFEKEERLRFLMPVRNPLDCAKSNLKTGHAYRFNDINESSGIEDVVKAILKEFHWFATYKRRFPDRFFYYFENSISYEMIENLADFLKLEKDKDWLLNARSAMVTVSGYKHDKTLIDFYRKAVEKQFADMNDLQEKLLSFYPY